MGCKYVDHCIRLYLPLCMQASATVGYQQTLTGPAMGEQQEDMVSYVLSHEADVNAVDEKNVNACLMAAATGKLCHAFLRIKDARPCHTLEFLLIALICKSALHSGCTRMLEELVSRAQMLTSQCMVESQRCMLLLQVDTSASCRSCFTYSHAHRHCQ